MSKRTWVLVANRARARILASDGNDLREVAAVAHPEGRLPTRELVSDQPGRVFDSAGEGRHGMGQPVEPEEHEAITFAKELRDQLDRARNAGEYERLMLIAGPAMLGLLRDNLGKQIMQLVEQEIPKDLTERPVDEIRAYLPERL